jgi:hypothetical protein
MPEDRLRHDEDDVENLDDLINAREESSSDLARDTDAFDKDFDIPEDIDVDDALTFPHPKHKKDPVEDIDLMSTPHKEDSDINWAESQMDMLPTDYEDDYDDALTTNLEDEDEVAEDDMEAIGHIPVDEMIYDVQEGVIPERGGFRGEEAMKEEEAARHGGRKQGSLELESAMDTESDEEVTTVEDKFRGEVDPEKAREILRRTKPDETHPEGKQ